jgi:two-component system chemotaxis response regulator CheY
VIHETLAQMLEPAGFRVAYASNGAEAIASVREECPYFIITDWNMSPVDGVELCRHLRQAVLPHYVYVVLLSARSRSADLVNALRAGADDFVIKPVHGEEILARLHAGARILDMESRLSKLARCDSLTGLLNRRTFFPILEAEWSRAARYGRPLSCVMMDADHFKRINDTFGHLEGDRVLTLLARTMQSQCRGPDHLCRYGGEEFCILLPETDEAGALAWASRCGRAIAAAPFSCGDRPVSLTVSFGVAQRTPEVETVLQLLDRADQALLTAKERGRNQVCTFAPGAACDRTARGEPGRQTIVGFATPVAERPAVAECGSH